VGGRKEGEENVRGEMINKGEGEPGQKKESERPRVGE
jgi:hypothetical protein